VSVPDLNDPRPVYVQIADDLRAQIKSGRRKVGTRLPPQRELADLYKVAAGTLRSALDELVREGVLSAGSTRGTFVLKTPGEPEPSPEYRRILEHLDQMGEHIEDLERRMSELESGRRD
jgi:DNA-binding GntR family transcriptional regulator